MQAELIKQLIEQHLPNSTAQVEGADGQHFSAVVIAEIFVGKTKVQQQQLVYQALTPHIQSGELHALALKTYTPQAWADQ